MQLILHDSPPPYPLREGDSDTYQRCEAEIVTSPVFRFAFQIYCTNRGRPGGVIKQTHFYSTKTNNSNRRNPCKHYHMKNNHYAKPSVHD